MVRHFCPCTTEQILCIAESRGDNMDCDDCCFKDNKKLDKELSKQLNEKRMTKMIEKDKIKGIVQLIFGATVGAIGFIIGLIMIANAGYNTGDIGQMVNGGVLVIVGMFFGGLIMDVGIKNCKLNIRMMRKWQKKR